MCRLGDWWPAPWRLRSAGMVSWFAGWLGDAGEREAARFLRKLGYRIIARRMRIGRGDIDLVALDGTSIVFVEVKTRSSAAKGSPAEAVDSQKQRKLTRLALEFLKSHRLLEHSARFDVVSIVWPSGRQPPEITHFRNAFPPVGRGQMFS